MKKKDQNRGGKRRSIRSSFCRNLAQDRTGRKGSLTGVAPLSSSERSDEHPGARQVPGSGL